MNKIFLFSFLLPLFFFAQDQDFTLGKVPIISGKMVFDNVEPTNTYDIVFSFENLIPNYDLISVEKIWDAGVNNAMVESGYQGGKPFDGIITRDGAKRDIAIKFKTDSKDISLGQIGQRVEGIFIFTVGEPSNEYDYIATLKVNEEKHTTQEAFEKIIHKAKKKYGNFNGIIFSSKDLSKASLIKFRDLEISGGGFRQGDYAMHQAGIRPSYGEVVSLDNVNQKAGFKYIDAYGDELLINIAYKHLAKVDSTKFFSEVKLQAAEILLHKFSIDEKVEWSQGGKSYYGVITSQDDRSHNAKVSTINIFGEEEKKNVDYLELNKLAEETFEKQLADHMIEVAKYQFEVGEKVSFKKKSELIQGEIIELNENFHKASVQYTDEKGGLKKANVSYLKINKVE